MLDLSILHQSPFYELTSLLALAAVVGLLGQVLRQPMIVSFIAVGILAGPSVLGLVGSNENVELLAELGIAVLLFLVGLKLDLKLIKTLGPVSLATGLGQVLFTSLVGFGLGLALGLETVTSVYVAIALTFSSTIIIVKLLTDKKEVDALHGRIAIGFLIVQDLVVVLAMMALSAVGVGAQDDTGGSPLSHFGAVMLKGGVLVLFVALFMRFVANPLTQRIAHSSELLIVFSIAWAALLASIGHFFGFSQELGGLLAGVSLASTPFREAIVARLSSLRDFLLLFFFIALGTQLDLSLLGAQVLPALAFSVFVLIGNPLIVMVIMGSMGYRKRTGFLAGLTVAQISEFSLIFMAMGLSLGHVSPEALGLVTLVGLVTIALSVYMITYSHDLYRWLEPALGLFERKMPHREQEADSDTGTKAQYEVIIFGLGRYGSRIADQLLERGVKLLAVDFNPEVVKRRRRQGLTTLYGDACDHEFIDGLPLKGAKWVIAAMPQNERGLTHEDPRVTLMDGLRRAGFKGRLALSTNDATEVESLKDKGADLVFLPFQDAASRAAEQLCDLI